MNVAASEANNLAIAASLTNNNNMLNSKKSIFHVIVVYTFVYGLCWSFRAAALYVTSRADSNRLSISAIFNYITYSIINAAN